MTPDSERNCSSGVGAPDMRSFTMAVGGDCAGRRESSQAFGPPTLEQLEPRLLLSGVTLITHGHMSGTGGWVSGMAGAIADRIDGDSAEYTLVLTEDSNDLPNGFDLIAEDITLTYDIVDSGEVIIKVDWSAMTTGLLDFGTSTTDVGYYLADWLTGSSFAEMPIHLIGHSRGASVSTAIAERLAESGVWVDHVTTLDPHPIFDDSPIDMYDSIRFADNFWRTGFGDIGGESVAGAHNELLNEDVFDGWWEDLGYGGGHDDVHLWYHGTIDNDGEISDTEETVSVEDSDLWYDDANGMPGPRDEVGFHYSLIAGGDRTELGGGLASVSNREHVTRSGPQWANLDGTLLFSGSSVVHQGVDIPVVYRYQAVNSCDISFGFDFDRNPYNSSLPRYRETIVQQATSDGAAFDDGDLETYNLDTSLQLPGAYYLVAQIIDSDSGQVRYAYSTEQITVAQPGDADGNGVVDVDDYEMLIGELGLSGTGLVTDFDGDGRVGLSDFAILRSNFDTTLKAASAARHEVSLAAPAATLQLAGEPAVEPETQAVPVLSQTLLAAASPPAVDLLGELFLVNSDISAPQPISAGSSSPALYRAATAGYDLRPLRDDLLLDNPDNMIGGGLHISIGMDDCLDLLAESAVAIDCA
jgi:hypothetical protein